MKLHHLFFVGQCIYVYIYIYVLFSDSESDQELWWKVASCGGNLSAPADCISVEVLLDMHDL